MMMMVLTLIPQRFAHMMGESISKIESFVLPEFLNGAEPVICKTIEDGAAFCMVEYR